jgi:hypothetical protein
VSTVSSKGGDAGTRGRGDAGTRGRGDAGTRGRGDAGTRGCGGGQSLALEGAMAQSSDWEVVHGGRLGDVLCLSSLLALSWPHSDTHVCV